MTLDLESSSFEKLTVGLLRLHPNQRKVKGEANRFNVVACGRRWGKTVLGNRLVCDAALNGQTAGWFAPEYKLLAESWRDIRHALADVTVSVNDQQKRIELLTGGVIEAWSFDRNPNAGRSRKYHLVVFDEAAFCRSLEVVWTKAVRPTLTDYMGTAWFLSSPNGQDYFHRLYQQGQESRAGWNSWTQTSYDNPYLAASEIDEARRDLPDLVFRQEYLAEFLADVHAVLIPAWWADRCCDPAILATVEAMRAKGQGGVRILAVDLSVGSGRDKTTVCVRDRLGVLDWHESAYTGVAEAAKLVADLCRRWDVADENLIFDAGGPGRDFPRYLETYRMEGTPYHGGAPSKGKWTNRRTRMAWKLRQRLDPERPLEMEPDPKDDGNPWKPAPEPARAVLQPPFAISSQWLAPTLREELTGLRYEVTGGKIALEDKDKFMERLGRSPDACDALMMTMFANGD
jgi:hypothetical protein